MKNKIWLCVCFLILSIASFAQNGNYPNVHIQSNEKTLEQWSRSRTSTDSLAALRAFLISGWFVDTNQANLHPYISSVPDVYISTGQYLVWRRTHDAKRWVLINGNGSIPCPDDLIGSATYSGTGLDYDVTRLDYHIGCNPYTTAPTTLPDLAADPSFDRKDIIVCDINSQVYFIQGVPGSGIAPSVNPFTQKVVAFVDVNRGFLTPADQSITMIYDENIEWGGSSAIPVIDFTSTTPTAYSGSVSTFIHNPANGSSIQWVSPAGPKDISNGQYLKFRIKLSASPNTANSLLNITFFDVITQTSQVFVVNDGAYGLNYNSTAWQLITIPIVSPFFANGMADRIIFSFAGASGIDLSLDKIYLLEGGNPPPIVSGIPWYVGGNFGNGIRPFTWGSLDKTDVTAIANNVTAFIISKDGILEDSTKNVKILMWNPVTKYLNWRTIDSIGTRKGTKTVREGNIKWIEADLPYLDSAIGGGSGSVPVRYLMSNTEPTDTTVGWINTSIDILKCYPVQYRVNGSWSAVDTIGGQFWDNIGKVFSRGKPYKIIATGQSNLGGPYIGEAADPNAAPFNGYYGDTIIAKGVCAWNYNSSKWVVAKILDTPFQYSSGANYLLQAAKKIFERTGRSVRIVTYPQGGTGLQCWAGIQGHAAGDSACYIEFKNRIQGSGLQHPDLFIWAQSEAGIADVGITVSTYFNKWKEMVDTMIHKDHLMDTSTLKILMHSGDTVYGSKPILGNGSGGGEGALRALAATNDRTIKYVDGVDVESDGLHITPKGHEEDGRRLFIAIMDGQKVPGHDMMGYNSSTPAPWKLSDNKQMLAATGLYLTGSNGHPYIDLEAGTLNTTYTGATPDVSNRYAGGLVFDPIGLNNVRLIGYNGTSRLQIEDTRTLSSVPFVASGSVQAYSGGNPYVSIYDITSGKDWKFYNDAFSNTLRVAYNGSSKWSVKTTGEFGIGTYIPDSTLHVIGSTHFTGTIRVDALPQSAAKYLVHYNPATGKFSYADSSAVGVGGSSLFPTIGTGTATGNVEGDINGHQFNIVSGSDSILKIDPVNHIYEFGERIGSNNYSHLKIDDDNFTTSVYGNHFFPVQGFGDTSTFELYTVGGETGIGNTASDGSNFGLRTNTSTGIAGLYVHAATATDIHVDAGNDSAIIDMGSPGDGGRLLFVNDDTRGRIYGESPADAGYSQLLFPTYSAIGSNHWKAFIPKGSGVLPLNVYGNLADSSGVISSVITGTFGGTGINNGSKTITLGGNFTTSGAFNSTFTFTGTTGVTFPTTGTLATLAGSETLTNKTLTSPTLTTPALGSPASGNFSSGTFTWPTFNQNSTGTANISGGTAGAIPYQSAANTTSVLAATATANKMLLSGSSAAPTWSTSTIPTSAGSSGNVLTSDGTNYVSSALSANTTTVGAFNLIAIGLGRFGSYIEHTSSNRFTALSNGVEQLTSSAATANTAVLALASVREGYVAKTANYTAVVTTDKIISCSTNAFTVTLPTAVGCAGQQFIVTNSTAANTITIGTTSSQTFANVTDTPTSITIIGLGSAIVASDGANWLQLK